MLLSADLGHYCRCIEQFLMFSLSTLVLAGDAGTHGDTTVTVQAEIEPVPGHTSAESLRAGEL